MTKKLTRKEVLENLSRLSNKSADDSKYVDMRDGEKPKKSARVMVNDSGTMKPGTAVSSEKMTAPTYEGQMKDHLVVEVQHPAGTQTQIEGVGMYGTQVAPTTGFTKHYDSSKVKVHQDDIIAPK